MDSNAEYVLAHVAMTKNIKMKKVETKTNKRLCPLSSERAT